MAADHILFVKEAPLAWITFNRPEKRNALTFPMWDRLGEICGEVAADASVRVLILQGSGGEAFVSGTDIDQFRNLSTAEQALGYEERLESVFSALENLPVPTIAKIEGYATGGGLAIALVCDLRLCAPNARFGAPIARTLGNCLSITLCGRLVETIGAARAKELIYTARLADANEALQLGLVNEVSQRLEDRVKEVARTIAANAPLTLRATKAAIRRVQQFGRPPADQEPILQCYLSEDFKEGVAAFLEKRRPNWQGK